MAVGPWRGLLVLFGLAGAAIHLAVVRPRQLTWGATADEVSRPLPGDDLVACPTFLATRAISVAAPPEEIWPWLVQVGVTRAGWYSYDLLDNLGRPSARRVVPELQNLAPGDVVPMSPDGRQGLRVHAMDPPRTMVWGTPGDTTWVWQLEPRPDGTTRVLTRIRSRIRLFPMSIAFSVLLEVADFWMIRKMLLNLRDRAEGRDDEDGIRSASMR
ncbi:hypothetical protein [Modestobacter sp. VKM Ac-2981]|nr:hypothetical protein [Modestobacter sp. VKM Ac-2981]